MLTKLQDVSQNFVGIVPGEAVWMEGHIGVYIGDGKVIECTPRWSNDVQVTACLNVKSVAGLNGRFWTKHGKLPYVEYETEQPVIPVVQNGGDATVKSIQTLCNTLGLKDMNGNVLVVDGVPGPATASAVKKLPLVKQGNIGEAVKVVQKIVGVLADGNFGPMTLTAVKRWQMAKGLTNDGVVGPQTWLKMAKLG
jgi:lysozyme family protein